MTTKQIRNFQNAFVKNTFGKSIDECSTEHICPLCHEQITSFRDELSLKEFKISGMCQKCQDDVFAEPSDDEFLIQMEIADALQEEVNLKDNCVDIHELFEPL